MDTPFPENAGSYLSQAPMLPSPMLEPEKVAGAILDAATDPVRDVKVGAMSVLNTTMAKLMPAIADTMAKMQLGRQQRNEPSHSREGRLCEASESGWIKGRGTQNKADPEQARQTNQCAQPRRRRWALIGIFYTPSVTGLPG